MLKRLLLAVYLWSRKQLRHIKWYIEYRRLKPTFRNTDKLPKLYPGKYLVLIPHSDDEWIGCSTIIKDVNYNVVLCNMNMAGNDLPEVHQQRRIEMSNTAQRYGRILLECNSSEELTSIIDTEKPSYIVLPYFIDWHEEHVLVMHRLYDALINVRVQVEVVMCQITVPISMCNITHCNPQSKYDWKEKWRFFRRNYLTQKYFPWYRIACHERLNGYYVGHYAAEVFCALPSEKWKLVIEGKLPSPDVKGLLKENLGSLISIRNIEQVNVV